MGHHHWSGKASGAMEDRLNGRMAMPMSLEFSLGVCWQGSTLGGADNMKNTPALNKVHKEARTS